MKKITRRNLLRSSALLATASGLQGCSGSSSAINPSTKRTNIKAAVIGSGFGGSVATLRLAQAGIPTALIERGRHWVYSGEGSYPNFSGGLGGAIWVEPTLSNPGATGMLQQIADPSISVGCGAGLGGGSLVYGGVLLQPRREIFEQALPQISYDDMHNKYYPKVLSHVSGGPIPDDILNSSNYAAIRAFIDTATAAGMEVVRSEVGFNWDIIRDEIEGRIAPHASIGDWVLGCNSGAKNTLDRNYLTEAAATGKVDIYTLHNVVTIQQQKNGSFDIICDVLSEDGIVISNHIISCQYLFMAAGSVNTTRLLLKAKALGDLPTLNDAVGEAWGTNGDELMAISGVTAVLGLQGGPPSVAAFDLNNGLKPVGFMHSPTPSSGSSTQLQMGMCIPDQTSKVTYDASTDRLSLNWSRAANTLSHNALIASAQKMAAISGGVVIDQSGLGTWHPVGGAAMDVACSSLGEVYGTPNLFVVDGATIPGSTGAANPSLTIGANAERIMEGLIPTLNK